MNLTFKGFMRGCCRELTGLDTDNLKKLCHAVDSDAPAAAEAVMVFAALQNKAGYLLGLSRGTWMADQYQEFFDGLGLFGSVEEYLCSAKAPSRYRKVWDAFRAKKDAIQADRRVISLMRTKTLDAMDCHGLTAYAVCNNLNLNLGNIYAYLHKGDVSKVSRATARKVMQYACGL